MEQPSISPPDDSRSDRDLWKSPFIKTSAILAIVIAFLFGIYLETTVVFNLNPLGFTHLRNNLGLVVYSLIALLFTLFSAAILYRALQLSRWSAYESHVFYLGLLMGLLYLLNGTEYVLFGEIRLENPVPFYFLKNTLIFAVVILLFRIIFWEWLRQRVPPSRDESQEEGWE
ncbi:MAG TPA: hypothetical protein PK878_17275 [bacterium]|nr:hypothetical protein [Candidatus Omnitrophota bacterium]HOJ62037.1 hypothetical protein [bacterium]HOL92899.1 hypothetical protein [bacterium]HPO99961.1 hypothetical protein [bacterium]HXK92537.1 hypothetical protein [bacterium]